MTVLFYDGFDQYGSSVPVTQRWTLVAGTITYGTAGRLGGKCIQNNSAFGTFTITHTIPVAKSSLSVGVAFKTDNLYASKQLLTFNDSSNVVVCTLFMNASGDLVFVRGNAIASNVLSTVSAALATNIWYHIGIEFTRNASTGTYKLYVNGVALATLTGLNTGASDIKNVGLSSPGSGVASFFDDYYCVDGATWLGELRVTQVRPSADTATKDFTPDTGTANFSRVNGVPMDGDTTYVSGATVNNTDLYDFDDLGYTPASIKAVQTVLVARKDDATTRTLAPLVKSSSTTHTGADVAMSTSYATFVEILETDPNTSAAWTVSAVNAMQAGFKVTA